MTFALLALCEHMSACLIFWKLRFRPAFEVRSTQMLVKIYKTLEFLHISVNDFFCDKNESFPGKKNAQNPDS